MSCVMRTVISFQQLSSKAIPVCWNSSILLSTSRPPAFIDSRTYAVIAPKKTSTTKATGGNAGGRIKEFPVETDTRKLQEYCCGSNILQGGEDIKLKPESEYPDWLFTLHCGPPKPLEELDPNSKEYWEQVRRRAIKRKFELHRFRVKIMKKF